MSEQTLTLQQAATMLEVPEEKVLEYLKERLLTAIIRPHLPKDSMRFGLANVQRLKQQLHPPTPDPSALD